MDARLRTSGMTNKILCVFTYDPIGTYLKIGICEEFVTLAKAGVHLRHWKTWIPACAGMTTGTNY